MIQIKAPCNLLGHSQYLATCRHLEIVRDARIDGASKDFGRIGDACQRLEYGRLAVALAGADPNQILIYAVWNASNKLVIRHCDDFNKKVVLVRLHRKPVLEIVGWTYGVFGMAAGRKIEIDGLGMKLPANELDDRMLNPVNGVQDLRP